MACENIRMGYFLITINDFMRYLCTNAILINISQPYLKCFEWLFTVSLVVYSVSYHITELLSQII